MQFSNEQSIAFQKYLQGKNIFLTGPGGTGKSALIREIQADAYKKCVDLQVCALTMRRRFTPMQSQNHSFLVRNWTWQWYHSSQCSQSYEKRFC